MLHVPPRRRSASDGVRGAASNLTALVGLSAT
jgi:hypothetical protein